MTTRSAITTSALALAGIGLWSLSSSELRQDQRFDYQPNPLGLKMSPYGQVLAMAIQAPIDQDWHGGLEVHEHGDHDHDHAHDHGHAHGHTHHHEHDHDSAQAEPPFPAASGLLARLDSAVSQRTNPNAPTRAHRLYIRREIERKLRFAYQLDPSHYANYNAYHLFLVYHELGTSGRSYEQSRPAAFELADRTIRYCLRESLDPRPALTGAAAADNVLQMMLSAPERYSTREMRERLALLDHCLTRHFELFEDYAARGLLAKLSEQRRQEIADRSHFALKMRATAEETILRLEQEQGLGNDPS